MDKIYLLIGNDTPLAVCLRKSEGEETPVPYDLSEARHLRLTLVGHGMRVCAKDIEVSGDDDNVVSGMIPGRSLLKGDYDLEVTFTIDGRDKRFAIDNLFEAVDFLAEDADGETEGEGAGIWVNVTVQPEVIEIAGPTGPKGDTPVLTADEDGTIYADGVLLTEVVKDVTEAVESAETQRAEQASSDHTRAENDHTRAESDHTRAEEAAAAAEHMVDIKQGPQGPQGNTGASVDYPYELVNNLTTDDATKGLSAAQGMVLDEKVSQLRQELYDETPQDLTDVKGGFITGPPYSWYGVAANLTKHLVIPCAPGETIQVKGNATTASIFTWLKTYSTDSAPDLCSGASLVTMALGEETSVVAPADAAYLYFTIKTSTLVDRTPQFVKKQVLYFDEIGERLDEIGERLDEMGDDAPMLEGKILAINNKIAGVNVDITDDVVYTNGKVWNSSLQLVTLSTPYNAATIDVSQYVGATLKVFTYGGNTGYQGFKLDDGTLYQVELIPSAGYQKQREFVIPPRAVSFYFSYATSVGITQKVQFVLSSIADDTIYQAEGGEVGEYNDVKSNLRKIALFKSIFDKGTAAVDKYNRVVVSFNGDSIIGSQLDDITPSPEYDTGAYPPNMSKMIMARRFFDKYRFAGEDVVFRNLEHSDWVKTGFNANPGKQHAFFNKFEWYGCASADDSAQITVSGHKYFKLVWSRKEFTTEPWECSVLVSVDGGAFTTPTQAGIALPDNIGTTTAHEELQVYAICELNPAKTYTFKIQPTSNYANVKFWGCEYWTAPRLDCVVEAFSGSYARLQKNWMPDTYFSSWHQPKIVISDILSINDQTYFNTGGYTMTEWMNCNKELYNKVQDNGISLILFSTHVTNTLLPSLASSVGIQGSYAFIDIAKKLTVSPPEESVVNTSDGLHLSNYGNAYYFAELERLFG